MPTLLRSWFMTKKLRFAGAFLGFFKLIYKPDLHNAQKYVGASQNQLHWHNAIESWCTF